MEQAVAEIQAQIMRARVAVAILMPEQIRPLAMEAIKAATDEERWGICWVMAEKAIEIAEVRPSSRRGRRAYCPLCRRAPDGLLSEMMGFSYPQDLRKHLTGRQASGRRAGDMCPVLGAFA